MKTMKTWSKRIGLGLLALIVLVVAGVYLFLRGSLAQLDGSVKGEGLSADVTITRDANGVPTISAATRLDLSYASGYLHAQERYFQMDLLRRSAAGELSELFGARALKLDQSHRLHRFRARAIEAIKSMDPTERALLERYTAGVNAGFKALAARPFEYALVNVAPRPWQVEDSLLVSFAMYFDLQGNGEARELSRGWLRDHSTPEQLALLLPESTVWDAPMDAPAVDAAPAPIPATAPSWWGKAAPKAVAATENFNWASDIGSNNWAVSGQRSKGGAILSDDMHLGIRLPNTWYRAVLQYPDAQGKQRRLVGVMLPGAPLMVVGSNGHVAWGFTNSYGDYTDLIELEAKDGKLRLAGGAWASPQSTQEVILVKGEAPVTLSVRETSLGPLREAGGRTYAVHWSAHLPGAVNLNLHKAEGATSLTEVLDIAAAIGIPAQNFTAVDDQGNIGWTIGGPLPKRGAYSMANSFPLKADDPGAQWQGWIAPGEHPRLVNPAGGQLWTANSRQLAGAGAELIGDGGFDLGARAQQVRDSLTALGASTDVKGVYGVTLDDRALYLTPWRTRLMAALEGDTAPTRVEALRLLKTNWTGRASIDSAAYRIVRGYMNAVGEILFEGVNEELEKLDGNASMASASGRWSVLAARLLDEQPAAWLPARYQSWKAVQLDALDRTVTSLTKDGKSLAESTWGARNTSAIGHPMSGAIPLIGRWLNSPPDQIPGDSHMPRVSGATFGQSERMTVTPGKEEQGIFNMPGGQSGHPLSPHFLAGHADWVSGKATPLLPGPTQHTLVITK